MWRKAPYSGEYSYPGDNRKTQFPAERERSFWRTPQEWAVRPDELWGPSRDGDKSWPGASVDTSKTFQISNLGNKNISMQFWEPQGAKGSWKEITLGPGTKSLVSCPSCDKTVHLAYHDGKQPRRFEVILKGRVVVDWSASTQTWEMQGATEVAAPK